MRRSFVCVTCLLATTFLAGVAHGKEEVLARVNKAVLTVEGFEKQFQSPQHPQMATPNAEVRGKMLDHWIEGELLYQEALKRKLDRNKEVQERIEELKHQIMIQALVNEEIGLPQEPSDEDVRKYYEEHREQFTTPERVKIAVIQVPSEEDAKAAMSRIEGGEEFAKVASEVSTDRATKARGGELGPATRDRLKLYGTEVVEAAFALDSGKLGGPVKGTAAHYLLKSAGKLAAQDPPLAQVKGRIQSSIKMEKRKEHFAKFLALLKEGAKIEKHPELLPLAPQATESEQETPGKGIPQKPSN